MHHIEITHNPFIVETQFSINGQPPGDGCKLTSYRESRLQVWVEKLFEELSRLFNGDNRFRITFTGVESDYLDVFEAARSATNLGMRIETEWVQTAPINDRLEQVRDLMNAAREHPSFNAYIAENQDIQHSFEEAFNADFDVYVVATMSSGKSTLINAMLGVDLLPAANEATTATITRIVDDKTATGFSAVRIDTAGQQVDHGSDVTLETITLWNKMQDTARINIAGNIKAIEQRESVRLVLTDTPGPNNSQDQEHALTTMSFIQDTRRNPLILYVLNASQLGTNDDRNLLHLVANAMRKGGKQSKDRFVFVINKMDVFDSEKGEDLPSVLARVSNYLIANGIPAPQLYPVSANFVRLMRKRPDMHSRKERNDFAAMSDLFEEDPSMPLEQYMQLTARVQRVLDQKRLSAAMRSSGVPAVEAMIDEYIDKYNLPHRLKRAYDALNQAIEVGLNEVHLIAQLEQDEQALAGIDAELKALQEKRHRGFDAEAYKDTLAREDQGLPADTEDQLMQLEATNNNFILQTMQAMTGKLVRVDAERTADTMTENLRFHFRTLVNEYELVFAKSQEAIRAELAAEYQRYVRNLFEDCQQLDLPLLEGFQHTVAAIALNLAVTGQDVQTRSVIVGRREVSTSSWFKPWTWGDTKSQSIYSDEEFVDLRLLWQERESYIRSEFLALVASARAHISEGKDVLLKQFLTFMASEFDQKFDALLDSISSKLKDKELREQALAESRQLQAWIADFKGKLDHTLSVESK